MLLCIKTFCYKLTIVNNHQKIKENNAPHAHNVFAQLSLFLLLCVLLFFRHATSYKSCFYFMRKKKLKFLMQWRSRFVSDEDVTAVFKGEKFCGRSVTVMEWNMEHLTWTCAGRAYHIQYKQALNQTFYKQRTEFDDLTDSRSWSSATTRGDSHELRVSTRA